MKTTYFGAILAVALILGVSAANAQQAQPAAPPAGNGIAVLDVSAVFKAHPRFKAHMDQLQSEAGQAEATLKQKMEALKQKFQQLNEFKSGSPDFKTREAELLQEQSTLNTEFSLQKREFMQREAKIYNSVYEEMMQEVEYLAQNYGVAMVMRFNGDPVDGQKPDDVIRRINQPIVWFPKDRNITDYIIGRLKTRAGSASGGQTDTANRPGIPAQPPR